MWMEQMVCDAVASVGMQGSEYIRRLALRGRGAATQKGSRSMLNAIEGKAAHDIEIGVAIGDDPLPLGVLVELS